MIPGKQYRPEDFIEVAWRRRWLIVLPFVVSAAVTVAITQMLQDRYRSDALLQVIPQRVPENYVRSTVTMRLDERLRAISQEILSRTQLERIIEEFSLYAEERQRLPMEDLTVLMRNRDVRFNIQGGGGAFTVGFESDDPRTAMQVSERLASLFIKANYETRTVLAEQTDEFLETQLNEARQQLAGHEKKLEDFRRANPGLMPAQMERNQQALQNAQMQLQALQESLNRDRDAQLLVQRQVADLTAAMSGGIAALPIPEETPQASGTAARALEQARISLKNMRMRYTADHPDIRAAERTLADLERKAVAEVLEEPVSSPARSGAPPAETAAASRLADLQAQDELLARRVSQKYEQEKELLATMSTFRQRLEAAPTIETRLTEMMRDYTTLQSVYQSLLIKVQEAKVATNLERRRIGEQFKLIDSPSLPQRPVTPDRPRLNFLGAFFGLAVGLGLAVLLEYRDTSLRTEDDVVVALSLPVLALIPTMTTAIERRTNKRRQYLASSGAFAVLLTLAAIAWKFSVLAHWIR